MNKENMSVTLTSIFYAAIAMLYVVLGSAVLFVRGYLGNIPPYAKIIFGVACTAYGVFRLYRAYNYYRENYEQE